MIPDLDAWKRRTDAQRKQTANDVAAALGDEWTPLPKLRGRLKAAAVQHVPTKTEFVVVPGGTFTAGIRPDDLEQLADVEWVEDDATDYLDQAAKASPPRKVTVAPVLIARAPLLVKRARDIVGPKVGWVIGDDRSDSSPIRFTKAQCTPILNAIPWRLPTAIEWEWVARDGGTHAFVNGATPDDAEAACSALYDKAFSPERSDAGSNGFGVWGMPWGDWIAKPNKPRVPHAGRGGAAMLYPWQSDELMMQLAGMGDDHCGNDEQCLRFAIDLPTGSGAKSRIASVASGVAMMAIVSKSVFEKDVPNARRGGLYATDRYTSSNKALAQLGTGGSLYLVTVRPPDERLWLVAVLEDVVHKGGAWVARTRNATPIRDISTLRTKLELGGKPLPTQAGKLGMSLQTPRVLTPADLKRLTKLLAD